MGICVLGETVILMYEGDVILTFDKYIFHYFPVLWGNGFYASFKHNLKEGICYDFTGWHILVNLYCNEYYSDVTILPLSASMWSKVILNVRIMQFDYITLCERHHVKSGHLLWLLWHGLCQCSDVILFYDDDYIMILWFLSGAS